LSPKLFVEKEARKMIARPFRTASSNDYRQELLMPYRGPSPTGSMVEDRNFYRGNRVALSWISLICSPTNSRLWRLSPKLLVLG
jgi:hypothetical protein